MASAEYAVYRAEADNVRFRGLFEKIDSMAHGLEAEGFYFLKTDDRTKIVLDCERSECDCGALSAFAEENGVFAEFDDGRYIVFMASLMTTETDLSRLSECLGKFRRKYGKTAYIAQKRAFLSGGERVESYCAARAKESESVEIGRCTGRVSAVDAGFFPPCYPVVTAGELITEEIAAALSCGGRLFGVKNGSIKVLR